VGNRPELPDRPVFLVFLKGQNPALRAAGSWPILEPDARLARLRANISGKIWQIFEQIRLPVFNLSSSLEAGRINTLAVRRFAPISIVISMLVSLGASSEI
jgi:hypothetical protein